MVGTQKLLRPMQSSQRALLLKSWTSLYGRTDIRSPSEANEDRASTLEAKNSKEYTDVWLRSVLLLLLCYVHLSMFTRAFRMYDGPRSSHDVGRIQPYATQIEDHG